MVKAQSTNQRLLGAIKQRISFLTGLPRCQKRLNRFTSRSAACTLAKTNRGMRKTFLFVAAAAFTALFATGCAGPEQKLGRGINNVTEFARMGEIRRSMEQTAVWESADKAYTTGFIHGLNRSLARTAVGVYEVLTFPIPSYDPVFLPEGPVYPDSYKPALIADPTFGPDAALGFSGGDVAPMLPGSRFRIFDY
jgi:putative exosortase-associated protein (TIGR04073 family)